MHTAPCADPYSYPNRDDRQSRRGVLMAASRVGTFDACQLRRALSGRAATFVWEHRFDLASREACHATAHPAWWGRDGCG